MKYLILFISLSLNAQLQSDWNATEILQDMTVSWSVGNGCLEANNKVVNVNSNLELNGNTLEVMDATIQVFGQLTNYGVEIETTNELIKYACNSSELIIYSDILSTEDSVLETFKLYPNPTSNKINIKGTFDYYTIYNINGKLVAKGVDNVINVDLLQNGLYFVLLIEENRKQILKFIKK